jgi:chromosome segregation ATPase
MLNRKMVCVSAILFAACLLGMPRAQAQGEQEPSVAEAARKAREQKKTPAKPSTVITNDTLKPATPASVEDATASKQGMPGTNAGSSSDLTADAASAAGVAKGPSEDEIAKKKAEIAALKQEVADKAKEVDLQQRTLALANESYYSRPDFSKDPDGKAKLDAMQSDLAQKKDELAKLKAKLKELAPDADQKPAAQPQ